MDALVDGPGGNEDIVLHNDRAGEEDSLLGNTTAPGQHTALASWSDDTRVAVTMDRGGAPPSVSSVATVCPRGRQGRCR